MTDSVPNSKPKLSPGQAPKASDENGAIIRFSRLFAPAHARATPYRASKDTMSYREFNFSLWILIVGNEPHGLLDFNEVARTFDTKNKALPEIRQGLADRAAELFERLYDKPSKTIRQPGESVCRA